MQSQVESLTTTNALMKEDLEIARANTLALMQENAVLKAQKNQKMNIKQKQEVSFIIITEHLRFLLHNFF